MVVFLNIVNTNVHFRPARREGADFFTQEEVRVSSQGFRGVDGIVIGDGNQIHPTPFQSFVDFARIAVAFAANPAEPGYGTHSRVKCMDVQIASHTHLITETVFRFDYVLKTFLKKNV